MCNRELAETFVDESFSDRHEYIIVSNDQHFGQEIDRATQVGGITLDT